MKSALDKLTDDLRRQRRWLIATGVPLAAAEFAFAFALDGWVAIACAISGTYVATRVVDLINEPVL